MAAMKNLTGVPSVYGDLGLAGQNQLAVSEEEKLAKKKKLMSASMSNDQGSATQFLFPRNQMGSLGV